MALASAAAAQNAADDLAWIENYLKRQRSLAGGQRSLPAAALDLAKAEAWRGRSVRVQLVDGRSRRGIIEQINPRKIKLRVIVNGGRFAFAIDRRQIHYVVAE